MTDGPGILSVMAGLLAGVPERVDRELRVAEPVRSFLRDAYAEAVRPGASMMAGIPVVVDAGLSGGQWQLHEDGVVVQEGDMAPAPAGTVVGYAPRVGWFAASTVLPWDL